MLGRSAFYFLGQIATFTHLTQAMRAAPQFDQAGWAEASLYNLLVANFWPLYWAAYVFDHAKLERFYWHVFEIAQARAGDIAVLFKLLSS